MTCENYKELIIKLDNIRNYNVSINDTTITITGYLTDEEMLFNVIGDTNE